MLEYLLKGIIVGLAASIPLGPIGILCIQRTLNKGHASGFITGMGAATGDTIFATLAILSLSYIKFIMADYKILVHIIGGLIVIAIGIRIFRGNPMRRMPSQKEELPASAALASASAKLEQRTGLNHLTDYVSALAMTLTNPGALLLILGLFSYVGLDAGKDSPLSCILFTIAGVGIGTSGWWLVLSTGINFFRNRFRFRQLMIINRMSGIIIIFLGVLTTISGIVEILKPVLVNYIPDIIEYMESLPL